MKEQEKKLEQFFKERQQIADPFFEKKLKESLLNDYYGEQNISTFKKVLFNLKNYMNKKTVKKIAVSGALASVLISGSYIYLIKKDNSNKKHDQVALEDIRRSGFSPEVKINNGYTFSIPNQWSAKVSSNTHQNFYGRFFPENTDTETSYIEVESSNEIKENQFIKVSSTQTHKNGDWEITTSFGKEDFKNSKREFKKIQLNKEDKPNEYFSVLAWNPNSQTDEDISKVIENITKSDKKNALYFLGYSKVQAADETKINNVSVGNYNEIPVMGEPIKEQINTEGKYYKFQAFKGQRLTAFALEHESDKGSYIQTELYSDQNKKMYEMGTRIEYTAPYTGTYYLKVRTFDNKSGEVLIKIFDRDQTEDKVYIKYSDGREKLVNPEEGAQKIGESEFAIIAEFLNPVTVISDDRITYLYQPSEFGPDSKVLGFDIGIHAVKQSFKDSNIDANGVAVSTVTIPEMSETNRIPHKLTRLTDKKFVITKADGSLFPKNYHFHLGITSEPIPVGEGSFETLGIGMRFFSENP